MKFLVKATMPVEAGNAFVKDPGWSKKMDDVMGAIQPITAYFCLDKGQRTLYMLIDMNESHRLPAIVEPLWHTFKADIEFIPTMTQEDFGAAMPGIEAAIKKFA